MCGDRIEREYSMHLYRRKKKHPLRWVLVLGIFLCAALFLTLGTGHMEETVQREQQELLQEAINQAVVNCYALEGSVFAGGSVVQWLIENYGIQVDFEKYVVSYEIFAENIRPQVRVIRIGEDGDGV